MSLDCNNIHLLAYTNSISLYSTDWIRDSALTMQMLLEHYKDAQRGSSIADSLESTFKNYASFSASNQRLAGIGEPKFHVNGAPFTGPWGRPQNDGPAIRASLFIGFAREYIMNKGGDMDYVKKYLYVPDFDVPSGKYRLIAL